MKKKKKSLADFTRPNRDSIKYQVSIRGKGVSRLTKEQAGSIVLRELNGDPTAPYHVRIKMWRAGNELDWRPQANATDEARAQQLRANLRRALQEGRITFKSLGNSR